MRCASVAAPCALLAGAGRAQHGGMGVPQPQRGPRCRGVRQISAAAAVSRPLLPRPRLLGRGRSRAAGCPAPRAEFRAGEEGLLPPPEVKSWSRKALRRLQREGPQEADLRDEVGRIVKECLPRACRHTRPCRGWAAQLTPLTPSHPSPLRRPGAQLAGAGHAVLQRLHGQRAGRHRGGRAGVERPGPECVLAAAAHPPALCRQAGAGHLWGRPPGVRGAGPA